MTDVMGAHAWNHGVTTQPVILNTGLWAEIRIDCTPVWLGLGRDAHPLYSESSSGKSQTDTLCPRLLLSPGIPSLQVAHEVYRNQEVSMR